MIDSDVGKMVCRAFAIPEAVVDQISKEVGKKYLKFIDEECNRIINGTSQIEPVGMSKIRHAEIHQFDNRANKLFTYRCGIDLASGNDQTGYGGRIE